MIASSVDRRRCCSSAGLTIPQLFLVVGLLNAVVAVYIFMLVPEYLLRFVAFVAVAPASTASRCAATSTSRREGAAILVCNHVSFVDAVLLMAASPRPIRFVMDHRIFKMPVLGWLFRLAKAIPIAPQQGGPGGLRAGLRARPPGAARRRPARASSPKARITRDGAAAAEFKGGMMKLLETQPGAGGADGAAEPVGLVLLARRRRPAMARPFRRGLFSRVGLVAGEAVAPAAVTPEALRTRVQALLGA